MVRTGAPDSHSLAGWSQPSRGSNNWKFSQEFQLNISSGELENRKCPAPAARPQRRPPPRARAQLPFFTTDDLLSTVYCRYLLSTSCYLLQAARIRNYNCTFLWFIPTKVDTASGLQGRHEVDNRGYSRYLEISSTSPLSTHILCFVRDKRLRSWVVMLAL